MFVINFKFQKLHWNRGDTIGKLAVLDISENGRQIGEKLFALLNEQQSPNAVAPPFTEIQVDDVFFCLEERKVLVSRQKIPLTAREFNAFQLLITNQKSLLSKYAAEHGFRNTMFFVEMKIA